jgi:adenylate cyclase
MNKAASKEVYQFEAFALDLVRGALLDAKGSEVPLRAKSFELLHLFVTNAGRLLDRDTINQAIWSDVVVTDDAITQCVRDIRRALGDAQRRVIRTVARRGYIFAARVTTEHEPKGSLPTLAPLPLADRPSIAVLAFTNMSRDPDQEFFSDGIASDIITELSRVRWLFVIARNSSFSYKDRVMDVKEIARELGVRYILEGSVRRSGDRVRVTAELIEVVTNSHIWAERYDRNVTEVFSVQDEITAAVAVAIEPVIANAEQQRAMRRPPEKFGAWEAYQRGLWHQARFDVSENIAAREFFERAAALDPSFSPAYQGLVSTFVDQCRLFLTHGAEETVRAAEPLARKSLALDANDAGAHAAAGWVSLTRGDLAAGIEQAERALALSANHAGAHRLNGQCRVFSGRHREGYEMLQKYLRLNPQDPRNWEALHVIALAHYLDTDYPGAVDAAERAIRANSKQPLSYRWLAAGLGQMGKKKEASEVLENAAATIAPRALDDYLLGYWPWQRQEDHDHMLDGLRKAGWRG